MRSTGVPGVHRCTKLHRCTKVIGIPGAHRCTKLHTYIMVIFVLVVDRCTISHRCTKVHMCTRSVQVYEDAVSRFTGVHGCTWCTPLTRITSFLAALPICSFVELDATLSGSDAELRMLLRLWTDAASAEKKDDAKRWLNEDQDGAVITRPTPIPVLQQIRTCLRKVQYSLTFSDGQGRKGKQERTSILYLNYLVQSYH